uniref:BSD domain-containing protein n=1 Tax=Dendroctonus ponderosae TaxID=77166 RepID=A0AAR5Q1F3_DENPD
MDMDKKPEELKIIHSQHARILKEDEEFWISSEDLNTENSSDDDRSKAKHACKKKLKLKDRKRSSPNIRLQRPSISSVASTSKALDERLLMPATDDQNARSTDDSRTSDEEYQIPPLIKAECLSKRLSLEDWRPMKGALNISSLDEAKSSAGDARKIVNETGNFCNAMLDKLKSLKSCSVLESARQELSGTGKTFQYLKNTPEVKQQLDFIKKLDEDINETISRYKAERLERLSAEFEMCTSINELKLSEERGTEKFLQICNFEKKHRERCPEMEQETNEAPEGDDDPELIEETAAEPAQLGGSTEDGTGNVSFIRKNIYAAREGLMAGFSLTDEEKAKIANILKDIDNFQLDEAELELSAASLNEATAGKSGEDLSVNAFAVMESDQIRMGEIDSELEKFLKDQNSPENPQKALSLVKDEEFWKQYALERSLKDIDAQLKKLYDSYAEDQEKLQRMREEGVE